MSVDIDLANKVAVITGASSGIGRGIAEVFADAGATLVIAGRRESLLREVAETCASKVRASVVSVDLALEGGPEFLASAALDEFGHVDILVNCAGGSQRLNLDSASKSDWSAGMRINYEVPKELTELLLPSMINEHWGRVISITGSSEPPQLNAASPAKAALHVWAKTLSRTVGVHGITVNSISPGRIDSEQIRNRLHPDPIERERFAKEHIPLGYFGDAEDVAYLAAFLASSLGNYITGEIIHVDGGMRQFAF